MGRPEREEEELFVGGGYHSNPHFSFTYSCLYGISRQLISLGCTGIEVTPRAVLYNTHPAPVKSVSNLDSHTSRDGDLTTAFLSQVLL